MKLVLELEQVLVERAKRYAKVSGKTVSQVVADYLALLGDEMSADGTALPPITRSLSGVLNDTKIDEQGYFEYLKKKYL